MKKFRASLVAGVLVLALSLTGCSSLGGEKWVAKVNGDTISLTDYNTRTADVQKAYEQQGMSFDSEQGKSSLKQIQGEILNSMIGSVLVSQDVKKQGLDLESTEVKTAEDNIKKQFQDDTQYQDWLKQQAMTADDVKRYLALSNYVTKDVKVTDGEIKQYFDSNQDKYGGQAEQVKASHILVKTEEEANAIIAQLQKSTNLSTDFAQLAKEKSTEPGAADSGGQLGYFAAGSMVPEFEKAAFAQKVGTISTTPVKTDFGYHVIFVEDHKQAVKADFTKVKDQVASDALNNAKGLKFETYFNDLNQKATIEYASGYNPQDLTSTPSTSTPSTGTSSTATPSKNP
ncbi:peptidylprolyl isomerase [Desulfitobacterium metallireducens]|uniref:Peptidylprolyl isomerase n=1 Tax=Desulfitobacterium metallireducens DSM 15288 TaxID=871968 RepID=W0E9K1_9FIRM|nr:peptidylprolyl isomerase [Desulfitobacterium metallireducens]AHF05721.1 peptidylprolyl isomerase [Desulfitobacterium metallireducens DSM 15288]